jgi:hypothetical protein
MPTTVVGLFNDSKVVDEVVREIEALGFARNEVRILEEPKTFEITGVMSFPRLEFEVALSRALARIGATDTEADAYLKGLHQGGALVFATGTDAKADAAREVMRRHGVTESEEVHGTEPNLPDVAHKNVIWQRVTPEFAGRVGRVPTYGSGYFAW